MDADVLGFGALAVEAPARPSLPGTDEEPRSGEEQPGETTRFGALAMRVWSPLLESERFSE